MPQWLRYLLSGLFCAGLEYSVFQLMHQIIGLSLIVANTIAYALAFIFNFLITKFLVFNAPQKNSAQYQFVAYSLLVLFNFTLGTWLLVYLVQSWQLQAGLSKLFSMVIVAVWNFFIFKKVVYR